jgi:hypothetical protein
MPKDGGEGDGGRADESKKERVDRELIELLNELRVALPGVQVLFAFLLTVAFSNRFQSLTSFQTSTYFVAFMGTAFASAFLIAPTAIHRLRFRAADKERILFASNRLAITGLIFLALSVLAVVFLIGDFVYGRAQALIAGGAVAVLIGVFWWGMPLSWGDSEDSG